MSDILTEEELKDFWIQLNDAYVTKQYTKVDHIVNVRYKAHDAALRSELAARDAEIARLTGELQEQRMDDYQTLSRLNNSNIVWRAVADMLEGKPIQREPLDFTLTSQSKDMYDKLKARLTGEPVMMVDVRKDNAQPLSCINCLLRIAPNGCWYCAKGVFMLDDLYLCPDNCPAVPAIAEKEGA
jgi:hypothetical protein